MSSETHAPTPTSKPKKPDLVSLPMTSVLVACVVATLGYGRGNAVLTWQLPLGIVVLAAAWTAFRARRART